MAFPEQLLILWVKYSGCELYIHNHLLKYYSVWQIAEKMGVKTLLKFRKLLL